MPFDAQAFTSKLSATLKLPVKPVVKAPVAPIVKAAVTAAPAAPSPSIKTFFNPAPTVANSTPAIHTGDTFSDTVRSTAKLLNPMKKIAVRPAFGLPGRDEVDIYGGPIVAGAHDIAARTIESIPATALKFGANLQSLIKGGKPASISTPYDISRLGMESTKEPQLVGADLTPEAAQSVMLDHKKKGFGGYILQNPDTGSSSVYVNTPDTTVTSSGDRAMKKLAELDAKYPDRQAINIAMASLEPIFDVLDATIVGDIGIGLAKHGLSMTHFDPNLEKALQQYGLKNTTLRGSALTDAINTKFKQKAKALVAAEDYAGLNELGEATDSIVKNLSGKGIIHLNRLGQVIQDASRFALQDPRKGFKLVHPMYPELAPEVAVKGLPGEVKETQVMPVGMSTQRVRTVGRDAEKPVVKPSTPEEATSRYFDEVLTPAKKKGGAVVIGADDMKDHFGGDYDLKNHPIYSKGGNDALMRAAKEHTSPTVIFTAGGPASGKSEMTQGIKASIDGVIYDSNLSNLEGARKQIAELRAMGKNVEIRMVLRDPQQAYEFAKAREARGAHPITDTAFIRNHALVPKNVLELAEKDGVHIKVVDTRNHTSRVDFMNMDSYEKDPIATLRKVDYNEEYNRNVGEQYGKRHGERRSSNTSHENGVVPRGSGKRPDKGRTNHEPGRGDEVLRSDRLAFEGFKDLSTKLLESLKGRSTVSKRYLLDALNQPGVRKAEKELFAKILKTEPDTVSVKEFANKVRAELLPLKRGAGGNHYENVTLPDELRGPVADYSDHIYHSPIKTSAGQVHFGSHMGDDEKAEGVDNYFGHTRVEDTIDTTKDGSQMKGTDYHAGPRRIIELQSDLFQKGRLEEEKQFQTYEDALREAMSRGGDNFATNARIGKEEATRQSKELADKWWKEEQELSKLEPYRNTWHERLINEEVKQAAKDGKTTLQFPTGETAMKIEGLGDNSFWHSVENSSHTIKPEELKVGKSLVQGEYGSDEWIITDVLGDGKFKAVSKLRYETAQGIKAKDHSFDMKEYTHNAEEQFDISGKVDIDNPIYKFYEKTVGKYLTNHYDAHRTKDARGAEWWEMDVKPEYANAPVNAYGFTAGMQQDDQGNVTFNPLTGLLGAFGGTIANKIIKELTPELMRAAAAGAKATELETIMTKAGILRSVATKVATRLVAGMSQPEIEALIAQSAIKPKDESEVSVTPTEEESYEIMANQTNEWKYDLQPSTKQISALDDNLTSIFSDLKGVSPSELGKEFTSQDLENARMHYESAMDALTDHPGRALIKYVSKTTGDLPEFTGRETMKSLTGSGKVVATSEWAQHGDDIFQDMVGQGLSKQGDVTVAQEMLDDYREMKKQVLGIKESFQEIRKNIALQKARDEFIESSKRVLAASVAKNIAALKNIVDAAERAGYRRGIQKGSKKFTDLVARLKNRRVQIRAIKKIYNLTDSEMRTIRGNADPRFMSKEEFDTYLGDLETAAREQSKKNTEKVIIASIIAEKNIKKAENLQRALEFPPIKEMSLEQLIEFGDVLSKTEADDTFLGPRMIQTAIHTDLGDIKTLGDGIKAIEKQSGMPVSAMVEGEKTDRWLRDSTLSEKDPLHKIFITEWAAREAEMLSRKYALHEEVNKFASAARKSRRDLEARKGPATPEKIGKQVADLFIPQDKLVVQWLQPFETTYDDQGKKIVTRAPELRVRAEKSMTVEELRYAKFLEKLFSHYYSIAAEESMARWTLLGVKRSNYKDIYFAHLSRSFLERARDDGFVKAFKTMLDKQTSEKKVDFNAFGDRGEVLGYEKWLNRNMTREGEGIDKETGKVLYTQNTAKVAMAYFHAFERKMILDSMIPKIKLLEFLMGKRFQTPKSISNPEGTEQVGSQLRKHINEWINNKKGQRIEMVYNQGDKAEKIIDGVRLFISMKLLGINVIAQVISGFGNTAVTLTGLGVKNWALGAKRMRQAEGKAIAKKYQGVIGESPWDELASASNDVGDTLRSGIFFLFGEMSYRSKKQMLLGLMTDEEFKSGTLSPRRVGEIKLEIGKWHPLPEQRSIAGSTSAAKAAGMFTEWAMPILQNTYFTILPKLLRIIKETPKDEWKNVAKSKEFQTLFAIFVGGAATSAIAYLLLNPDQSDHSLVGYMRNKAAQEISSLLQTVTLFGIPLPGSVMLSFIDQTRNALGALVTLQTYTASGDGYKEGDLKGVNALGRVFTPTVVKQAGELMGAGQSSGTSTGSSKSSNPALKKLQTLKKRLKSGKNPALDRLKNLKKRLNPSR